MGSKPKKEKLRALSILDGQYFTLDKWKGGVERIEGRIKRRKERRKEGERHRQTDRQRQWQRKRQRECGCKMSNRPDSQKNERW